MAKLTASEKLRIKFRKAIRKVPTLNAQLDPANPILAQVHAQPEETFIVKLTRRNGDCYWFSDRRIIGGPVGELRELLSYSEVRAAHWMYEDLSDRIKREMVRSQSSDLAEKSLVDMKQKDYDRIEVAMDAGVVVLDGLGEAYWPTLHFLWWLK